MPKRTPTKFDDHDTVLVRVKPHYRHIEVGKGVFTAGQTFYVTRERAKQLAGVTDMIGEADEILRHDPKRGPDRMMRNTWNR
jgi:hypothetical protein